MLTFFFSSPFVDIRSFSRRFTRVCYRSPIGGKTRLPFCSTYSEWLVETSCPKKFRFGVHFCSRDIWHAGLTYLHANGLCHLDISPENVLLYAGEPVVHDFGMATDSPVNSNWHNLMPHTWYVE